MRKVVALGKFLEYTRWEMRQIINIKSVCPSATAMRSLICELNTSVTSLIQYDVSPATHSIRKAQTYVNLLLLLPSLRLDSERWHYCDNHALITS
jgi:hypothetical protein